MSSSTEIHFGATPDRCSLEENMSRIPGHGLTKDGDISSKMFSKVSKTLTFGVKRDKITLLMTSSMIRSFRKIKSAYEHDHA